MRNLIIEMSGKNIGSLCLFLKNKKNCDYLTYLNDNTKYLNDVTLSERIYYFVNNIYQTNLCICGKPLSFIGFKGGHRKSCGDKVCYSVKRKETCIDKYGVDNPKKSKEILQKEKVGILNRWNGSHYMMNDDVKLRFKESMIKNHGVEWAQQSDIISKKSRESYSNNLNLPESLKKRSEKFFNKSIIDRDNIVTKRKNTIIEKYGSIDNFYNYLNYKVKEKSILNHGVNHHMSHPDIIKKRVDSYKKGVTDKLIDILPINLEYVGRGLNNNEIDSIISIKCLDCGDNFDINRQLLKFRIDRSDDVCLKCNPILCGRSKMKLDVLEFIKLNYTGDIISNTRSVIDNEIDIYLPDLGLAFEFNGLHQHSDLHKDKYYHINKSNDCLDKDIQLIHIWEDDWVYKTNIIKSIILNKIGNSDRIFARKCVIKEVDNKLVRSFLVDNHIQGFVGSKIKLGLFHNDELVSLMTFGSLRKSLGYNSKENSYELLRFCNKLNSSVIGGASKLFKHFTKSYEVNQVISYSDTSRGVGNLYEKLGFKFSHNSDPNYYWVINNIRKHRFNFRKDRLVSLGYDKEKTEIQIMNELGYYRIFDCGSKKWIKDINI